MPNTMLSIYGTVYNSVSSVEIVIKNLYNTFYKIKDRIEIVIVDNFSDDGTFEKLKEMSENYNIIIYRQKSTRGSGRNLAFQKTEGKYVLNRDFDDVYIDNTILNIMNNFGSLLDKNIIINELSRRDVIENIGNWSNLNAGEDIELRARAIKNGIRTIYIPAIIGINYKYLNKSDNGKTLFNENRYTKSELQYIKRMNSYLADTACGYGINMSDLKNMNYKYKLAFLYAIILSKIKKEKNMRHCKSYNNLEIVELHKEYLDPSMFGIPEERWVTTLASNINQEIINKKILELRNLGYNYVYKNDSNIIVSYNKDLKENI